MFCLKSINLLKIRLGLKGIIIISRPLIAVVWLINILGQTVIKLKYFKILLSININEHLYVLFNLYIFKSKIYTKNKYHLKNLW